MPDRAERRHDRHRRSQPHKDLLKYIIPFTGLPADYYALNPAEEFVTDISKSHAQAYVDHFYA